MAGGAPRVPISQLLANKAGDEEPKKKSREDWRKAKELEEARKAGTAPAAVDEEGKDINPHIPQYISSAPWYYGSAGPTLKHQRPQDEKKTQYSTIEEWYKKGVDISKVATKYRKGACENCGALTHVKKDCMERPRKVGAKFSGAKIAHDEFIQPNIVSDYDGKRDRWSGYDPAQHREIVEEYQKVEEAKRALKAAKLKDNPDAELSADEEDEDKYVDEVDMPGTKVDSKQRITVRNLRIREDTAKYLRNLDPNSAYYDPKTRSMRDNPEPLKKPEDSEFAGENFVRFTGDTQKHSKAQLFAWEAYGKGVDVHILAEPTKLELLQNEYEKKKEQFKSKVKDTILDRYGGEEHLQAPPKALLLAQTEEYVEYSRSGKVIKGQEKQIVRSRYEEDVLVNNHTAIWGSYWNMGRWGYKCCHSFIKNSYCLGESGKVANMAVPPTKTATKTEEAEPEKPSGEEESAKSSSSSSSESEEDEEEARRRQKAKKKSKKKRLKEKKRQKKQKDEEKDKLKEALKAEDKRTKEVDEIMKLDERKRPYNSMYEAKKPTEEEMEAFMMKRRREEDPMLQFLDS
uniref:Pre-mRNA-splicing factor SLU7 n=1 Tax=Phlebotomus kandelakii TaxID=1109342 RepID=A0A6B2EK89_9DIPT